MAQIQVKIDDNSIYHIIYCLDMKYEVLHTNLLNRGRYKNNVIFDSLIKSWPNYKISNKMNGCKPKRFGLDNKN